MIEKYDAKLDARSFNDIWFPYGTEAINDLAAKNIKISSYLKGNGSKYILKKDVLDKFDNVSRSDNPEWDWTIEHNSNIIKIKHQCATSPRITKNSTTATVRIGNQDKRLVEVNAQTREFTKDIPVNLYDILAVNMFCCFGKHEWVFAKLEDLKDPFRPFFAKSSHTINYLSDPFTYDLSSLIKSIDKPVANNRLDVEPQSLSGLFSNLKFINYIQLNWPRRFQYVNSLFTQDSKLDSFVGKVRETVIINTLKKFVPAEYLECDVSVNEPEKDLGAWGRSISVKTSSSGSAFKLTWVDDAFKSQQFMDSYNPTCDLLYANVPHGKMGGIYFIPLEVQSEVLKLMGIEKYMVYRPNSYSKGILISKSALDKILTHKDTQFIPIEWLDKSDGEDYLHLWDEIIQGKT